MPENEEMRENGFYGLFLNFYASFECSFQCLLLVDSVSTILTDSQSSSRKELEIYRYQKHLQEQMDKLKS